VSVLMTKQKKGSNATCLKGALDYQIWWLRFQVLARANGFDRIIKHREKYIDVVRDEAMAARMKNAKLHKEDPGDVGRSGGEEFDTPRTPRRELEMDSDEEPSSESARSSTDNSSGLESIATSSERSVGSSGGKARKKKRTIESKVSRKNRKLFDLVIKTVSDEIAMMVNRKADQDGCAALREIEKKYASSDSTRRKDLKSEMNQLDPSHFVAFSDYMEAIMQVQAKLQEMGKPRDAEEIQMLIEERAPKEYMVVIQTLSMQDEWELEAWIEELNKSTKRIGKKVKTIKGNKVGVGIQDCPVYDASIACQLCGGGGHAAKECKKWTSVVNKRVCFKCGKDGHIAKYCPDKGSSSSAQQEYNKSKKAFKAATKKLKKKKLKKKKKKASSSSSSSSEEEEESEESSESGEIKSSGNSSSGDTSTEEDQAPTRPRLAFRAKVNYGTIGEGDYLSNSSDDSTLSWEEYNAKSNKKRGVDW
jgi:hypothetical protein